MTFLHPEFLYYMLLPLFILFGFLLTQKENYADFFSPEVMQKLRVSGNTLTKKARNALFLLMGFFLILSLAQPVIKEGTVEVKAKSADIMIGIDISDSMLASDIYPNRLEAAKKKILALLDEKPDERIGVLAFAKNAYLVSPLSFDADAVAFLVRQLDTSSITEKATDIFSVLEVVQKVQKPQRKKYLLLLSDGGNKRDFSREIALAKKHNITVFVLATATKKGAPIKLQNGKLVKHEGEVVISKLNENIAQLAVKTGGVYIESTTSHEDIKRMFKEITQKSDQKELKSQEIRRYTQLFYYPLAISLFLLLVATSSFVKRKSAAMFSFLSLCFITIFVPDTQAGVLDFMQLDKAREAYEKKEYAKSAKLYEAYADRTSNGEAYYNAANAYYKQKRYKEAIALYKKATSQSENFQAKKLSNLGNAYAKTQDLQKAIQAYENALKIREDKETRENLEALKKLIQEQKSQASDQEKQEQKSERENTKQSGDENSQEKSKKQKRTEDSRPAKKESKESAEHKAKEDAQEQPEAKEDSKKKEQADKNERLEKSDANASSMQKQENAEDIMSDEEEKKWLKELSESRTYLYKLDKEKQNEDSLDEKPW